MGGPLLSQVMKSFAVLMFLLIQSYSFGQGNVNFANFGNGINAPVTNAAGNLIAGPPYVAHFFWTTNTQSTMDNLGPAGADTLFSSFQGGGYFAGGSIELPVGSIPIVAQVRVWDTNYGSSYYQARDNGGEFGYSNLIIAYPSIPPPPATPLFGLQGFQLQRVPHLMITLSATNTIVFLWPTEQTAYALQQNPDLSTNWVTLSNIPVTVGQQQQVVLPVTRTGRMFYRLISQ